jgi:C-terminal processing protease CtpA/Prc
MNPRIVGTAGSIALHALLILSLLHITGTAPKPPPQHTDWKDEPEQVTKLLRGADQGLVPTTPIADGQTIAGGITCADRSYVGIGIMIASFMDRVMMVGDDTPASRAGLLPGDFILNPGELGTNFEEGHVLNLRVSRDGVEMAITVAVRRICQD